MNKYIMQNNDDISKLSREFNKRRKENNSIQPYNYGYSTVNELESQRYAKIDSDNSDNITLQSSDSTSSIVTMPQKMKASINSKHLASLDNDDDILRHIKNCKKCQHKLRMLYEHDTTDSYSEHFEHNNLAHTIDNDYINYKQIMMICLISIFVVLLIDLVKKK